MLIFDLDGTISEPIEGIFKSINYSLQHFGFNEINNNQIRKYIGPPLDIAFMDITGISDKKVIRELVNKYRERFTAIGYSENIVCPSIPGVLSKLKQLGMALGVCTSKRADFAEKILKMFELNHYFDFVSGGDVGISKSNQLAGLIASAHIVKGDVMIGDRAIDLYSARQNGLQSVGVLWGYGSEYELTNENPTWLIKEPKELLEILGKNDVLID